MKQDVEKHYTKGGQLAGKIAAGLEASGKSLETLTTRDLAPVDEFHIRGRKATLELGAEMNLSDASRVLDLGSGLGGPARTLAETYGCQVTGIDLTEMFCEAAGTLSGWVGLGSKVSFDHGDATALPYPDDHFDAAMTIHVAMNIAAKDRLYAEAFRTLRPGGRFAVYDVIQGDGGGIHFPVPWAREAAISHLATHDQMERLLTNAGFKVLKTQDSSAQSLTWFQDMKSRAASSGLPAVSIQLILGDDYLEMVRNQIRNLAEDRIRTMTYICER
ncbi:class I SAM-dependent methyltransferase [Defluviimonas sp. WL0002]|uniref:Class I SAM-dependent methyltransferase n=1 Tax=Albidovulum marisflavi TaxID=2984159 RepID=A0ABT2ZCD4_9RHOB|nr:class I SAM-dependent methyltransferase [Defluviimonas sp. WL0002]MCV2868805.1 class I SAM-dependent methyltransferase [Defluviimonas sp. WL0002]